MYPSAGRKLTASPHFLTTLTPLGEEPKGQITTLLSTKASYKLNLNHIIKPYKKPEGGSDKTEKNPELSMKYYSECPCLSVLMK